MPRKPRIEYRGGLYHILNRGLMGKVIFHNADDYKKFVEYLSITQKLYPFKCYGYVLMPNHFHLIIERMNDPLSSVMKSLLSRYAKYYNTMYSKKGHVFHGRYYSVLCQKEEYLNELVRYIHLNPVRTGLANIPEEWKWSSYKVLLGNETCLLMDTDTVLKNFCSNIPKARVKLTEFTQEGINQKVKFDAYPRMEFPVLGTNEFINNIIKNTNKRVEEVNGKMKISLDGLNSVLCKQYKIEKSEIRCRRGGRKISHVRAIFSYIAHIYADYRIIDIARFIRKDSSAVTHAINKIRYDEKSDEIKEAKILMKNHRALRSEG